MSFLQADRTCNNMLPGNIINPKRSQMRRNFIESLLVRIDVEKEFKELTCHEIEGDRDHGTRVFVFVEKVTDPSLTMRITCRFHELWGNIQPTPRQH